MKNRMGLLAGALVLVSTLSLAAASAQRGADISEVMTKGHKKGGFMLSVDAELKKGTPDWKTIQGQSADFVKLAEDLGTNDPPKGSKDGWKKQCDAYVKIVKELDGAAQKKNKAGCTTAIGKLKKSCGGCHGAHKAD